MAIIVPAILPSSLEDLEQKLARLEGLATDVQIDVVDGRLAGPATWPYARADQTLAALEFLPHAGTFHLEADLMVQDPEQDIGAWIARGINSITIHAESAQRLSGLLTVLATTYGHDKDFAPGLLSVGLALNVDTDVALIEPYLSRVDYVQFMGIARIGRQGEPFDTRVLRTIAAFRKAHPNIPVHVDGGVSLATAPALLAAGVSRLIVGSALWKSPDIAHTLNAFRELAVQHGIYT